MGADAATNCQSRFWLLYYPLLEKDETHVGVLDTSICIQQSVVDALIQSIVSTQKMQTLYLYNAIELESKPLVTRGIRL